MLRTLGVLALAVWLAPGDFEVFNLTVDSAHAYLVGSGHLVVHNGAYNEEGLAAGSVGAAKNAPTSTLPRDPKTGNYLSDPKAEGTHTTLGAREGRRGTYTQGATFDKMEISRA